jgi:hypothetical protein
MSMWSLCLPADGEETVDIEQTLMTLSYLHLSNIALCPSKSGKWIDGSSTVSVIVNGEECVLATLEASGSKQHEMDGTLFDCSCTFRNRGKSPVYLLGKFTTSSLEDDDVDMEGMEELSDLDGETSSSDEEEAPEGVPLDRVPPTSPELLRLNGPRMGQGRGHWAGGEGGGRRGLRHAPMGARHTRACHPHKSLPSTQ